MIIYIISAIILQGNQLVNIAKDYIKTTIASNDSGDASKQHFVGNQSIIEITPFSIPNNVAIKDKNYKIQIELPNGIKFKGATLAKVNIVCYSDTDKTLSEEKSILTIPINFKIRRLMHQLIAKKRIRRHQIIKDEDISVKLVEENVNGISELNEIIGKRACKYIPKGKIIEKDMIEEPPLVEKGQKIEIIFKKGDITIYAEGIAKNDGWLNDIIEVNLGENLIKGKVIAKSIVTL